MSDNRVGKFWNFDEDGAELTACILETSRDVSTGNDKTCPIVLELAVEPSGERRSLWGWPTVLKNELLEELEHRDADAFDAGERIRVARGDKVASKKNPDRSYFTFKVDFLGEAEDTGQSDEIPF
jgi:hypothetical protein